MMKIHLAHCSLVAGALVLAGCNRSEPTASTTPQKESPPPQQAAPRPALPPGHPNVDMSAQSLPPAANAMAANPQWTVPAGWQQGKASSVRRGSFNVKGPNGLSAEIAVTAFPGDVGGMLANINRWRSQIGLGPITADQVDALTKKLDVNGLAATQVEFTGDKPPEGKSHPPRMIVVTIPHEGNSWFFKITGDAPLVEAQKETFLQFVKSVKF
jgi:hypothetical protein